MVVAAFFLGLAYLSYLAGSAPCPGLDPGVAGFISGIRTPALSNLMVYVTYLGNFYVECAVAAIAAVLLTRKSNFLKAATILVSVLGGEIVIGFLKLYLKRPRPPASYWLVHEFSYGFPSGHAFAAVSLYGLLLYLVVNKSGRNIKFYAAAGWAATALVLGFSRIYLGVHWTTDVLGGYALGIAWAVLLVSATGLIKSRP